MCKYTYRQASTDLYFLSCFCNLLWLGKVVLPNCSVAQAHAGVFSVFSVSEDDINHYGKGGVSECCTDLPAHLQASKVSSLPELFQHA